MVCPATRRVDVEKIKAQLRAEVIEDIMTMLAAQGLQIQPISRNPSPTPGRRSSCASASEPTNVEGNNKEDHHEDMNLLMEDVENREDQHDDMDLLMTSRDVDLDSIDVLTDPTPCALLIYPGGYQIEVARGLFYPKQTELHTVPILDDHVVVKVEYVHMNFDDHVLKPPPNDETLTLGHALLQKIQWNMRHIIVNPKSLDGSSQSVVQQTMDASGAKSASLIPSKYPSKDIARSASGAKSAAAAEKPFKSSQHKAAAAAADKKAAAAEPDTKAAAAAVDKNAGAENASTTS